MRYNNTDESLYRGSCAFEMVEDLDAPTGKNHSCGHYIAYCRYDLHRAEQEIV